jgi:cytochrome c oxidase subunit 2
MKRVGLLTLLLTAVAVGPLDGGWQGDTPPRVIHVVAERFTFTPSRISVEAGTTVELRITSDDTAHGFKLNGPSAIDVEIPKRGRGDRRVLFTAVDAGTYTFECSRVCGAGHGFMRGTLQVKARETQGARP